MIACSVANIKNTMKKICKICGRELPLEQFPTNRGRVDGHLDTCYDCWVVTTTRIAKPSSEERIRNRREYNRKYRLEHPYSEKERAKRRKAERERYYKIKADKEAYANKLAYMRAYYHAHHDKWDKYRTQQRVG